MELKITQLLKNNFKLIPVVAGEKRPAIKDWQSKATADMQKIKQWLVQFSNMNAGVVTGRASNVFVVDVDLKSGGIETLEQLKQEGFVFKTFTVKTGGGGYHFYYRLPQDKEIKNATGILKGIDIRGEGGFVVAPGSQHENGAFYSIIDNSPIEEMPENLYNRIFNQAKKVTNEASFIPEGQRNDTLFKMAINLNQAGVDKDTALEHIKAQNSARCQAPLQEDEIERIVNSAYSYPVNFTFTDVGNAQRLAKKYGDIIRYCKPQATWYIYKGTHWAADESNEIVEFAKNTVQEIACENNSLGNDKDLKKHFKNSQSEARIKAMINLASSIPGIVVKPQEFDKQLELVNFKNRVVNLKTGELMPHDKDLMLSKIINCDYNPEAKSELWENFLKQISNGENEFLRYLQVMAGYCLTGENSEQSFFILYGQWKNGKSVFIESLRKAYGDYAATAASTAFSISKGDRIRNDLAALEGVRLAVTSESNEYDYLDESTLKLITGGEAISVRKLYKEPTSFIPQFKVMFGSNYLPNIRAGGYSIERRIKIIEFRYTIPDNLIDKNLLKKLSSKDVQEAILAWAVAGAKIWYKAGLPENLQMRKNLKDYMLSNDIVKDFVEQHYQKSDKYKISCAAVYAHYCEWSKKLGKKALSKHVFGRRLSELGIKTLRSDKTRFYKLQCYPIATSFDGGGIHEIEI